MVSVNGIFCSSGYQPPLTGSLDGGDAIVHVQYLENIVDVAFDRAFSQLKFQADLLVVVAFRHELHDVLLAAGKQ